MGPKLGLGANFWWESSVWNSPKQSSEQFLILQYVSFGLQRALFVAMFTGSL